jgi:hypothetical protein
LQCVFALATNIAACSRSGCKQQRILALAAKQKVTLVGVAKYKPPPGGRPAAKNLDTYWRSLKNMFKGQIRNFLLVVSTFLKDFSHSLCH